MRVGLSVLFFVLVALACSQAPEAKIVSGDIVLVTTAGLPQYSGEFAVLFDGTVTVPALGRFQARGRSVQQLERDIRAVVRKFVKDPVVDVSLKAQVPRHVFLVSEKVRDGVVEWSPGLTLRQLIASHPDLQPLDSYVVRLYRAGMPDATFQIGALVREGGEDPPLDPGDVVAMVSKAEVPVWVVGGVLRPGEVRVSVGLTVAEAIAQAGGVAPALLATYLQSEIRVTIRRGEEVVGANLESVIGSPSMVLQPGDVISVEPPDLIRVSVGGEVIKPGTLSLATGTRLFEAVQAAGGAGPLGSLRRVLVYRQGEVLSFDSSNPLNGGQDMGPEVLAGDFVYVAVNERRYHVFGFVIEPGSKLMPDDRPTTFADALGAARGLNARGTPRHAVLLRPDASGRYVPTIVNFDAFLKSGSRADNPELLPGDVVFFDQPRGTRLDDVLKAIPGLFYLDRIFD